MNSSGALSLVTVCLTALSLCAGPAHASGETPEGISAHTDRNLALADPSSACPITDVLGKQVNDPWSAADAHADDHSGEDSEQRTGNDDGLAFGPDASDAQNERPWPGRSTVAKIHPTLSGVDSNGVERETALGPQYRLKGNVEFGGTSETREVSAMTTSPDGDRYTFGLRLTF